MKTTNQRAAAKQHAEDLAMQLIEGGLISDDPQLAKVCEKLKPFQDKLGGVSRDLVRQGLAMVEPEELASWDVEASAKGLLVALADKLDGMKSMLGIS
jgi:hypothetical protein